MRCHIVSFQPLPFGTVLKHYRRAARLTQEELAARAGYSSAYISLLERNVRLPTPATIAALAEALALTPAERASFDAVPLHPSTSQSPRVLHASLTADMPPLVGRIHELVQLDQHLEGVGPPLLLLAGEPGIGKTRLLREATERASETGWAVLEGGCHRRSGQEPYAPLLGALADHLRRQSPAQLRVALEGCAWLVRLLPELAEQALVPLPHWTLPPEQERRLMFAAVERYLTNVAGPKGTLLVLDDLQWAGADALDLLVSLLRPPVVQGLRVVGAFRSTEVRPPDPLGTLLADLASSGLVSEHQVHPLAAPDARELLNSMLEGEDGTNSSLQEQLLTRTGGVPYFLVSCAQALRAGVLEGAENRVPWNVSQSIRQRIAALPQAAQDLLSAAAIVGREAPGALLLTLAAQPTAEVVATLKALDQARLLVEGDEALYQFPHDLIREVVLADLSAVQRRYWHAQVAQALEQRPGEPAIELLAHHYAQADELEKASMYQERAGDRAEALFAYIEAESYYREAAARLEALGRFQGLGRIYLKWANMLRHLARHQDMEQLIEGAIARHLLADDLEEMGHAIWLLAQPGMSRSQPQVWLARIEQLLEEFKARGSSPGLAWLYDALRIIYYIMGDYRKQLEAIEQVERYLPGASSAQFLRHTSTGERGLALARLGRLEEGKHLLEALLPQVSLSGGSRERINTLMRLAVISHYMGRFAEEQHTLDQAYAEAERSHDTLILGVLAFRGRNAFFRGDWARARADLEDALARFREMRITYHLDFTLAELGRLCQAEGQREEAAQYLQEALALCEPMMNLEWLRQTQSILAEGDLLEGHPEQARRRLMPVLDRYTDQEADVTTLLPLLAWAQLDLGNHAGAEATLTQALARARSQQMRPALADALRVQAQVRLQQKHWEAAQHALEEALELCQAMPSPYAEAKALYVYGRLHQAKGEPDLARKRLEAALAILNRLGERLYAERVERACAASER